MREDKTAPVPTNLELMMRKASENTRKAQKADDHLKDLNEQFRRAVGLVGTDDAFSNYCEKYKITREAREYAIARTISKTKRDTSRLLGMSHQCKEFKSYADNPRVEVLCQMATEAINLDFVDNEDNQADDQMIQNTLRYIIRHSTNEANKVKAIESLAKYQQKTGDNATLARWRQIWAHQISSYLTMEMPLGGALPQTGHSE